MNDEPKYEVLATIHEMYVKQIYLLGIPVDVQFIKIASETAKWTLMIPKDIFDASVLQKNNLTAIEFAKCRCMIGFSKVTDEAIYCNVQLPNGQVLGIQTQEI